MRTKFGNTENRGVRSVAKALAVLDLLAFHPEWQTGMSLGALAGHLELPPNSVHGLLASLVNSAYVERAGHGVYRAGPKCRALGVINRTHAPAISQQVDEVLERLARATGEHCVLAILTDGRRRRLAHADSHHAVAVTVPKDGEDELFSKTTGRVLAAYATAAELRQIVERQGLPGAAWDGITTEAALAEALGRIRAAGYAEATALDHGVWAVSVPVLAPYGACVAALGVYAPLFRATPAARVEWTAAVRAMAGELAPILSPAAMLEQTA